MPEYDINITSQTMSSLSSFPIQIVILEKGLALHKQRIVPSLQGLHDKLEMCFEDVQCIVYPERRRKTSVQRSQTMAIRSSTLTRPLPPTPFDKKLGPQGGSPPQPLAQ